MSKVITTLKKNGYGWILALAVLVALGAVNYVYAESKRVTGTSATTGVILFDPKPDGTAYIGTSVEAVGDKLSVANGGGSQVKVWSRNPNVGKMRVSTACTTATTVSNIIVESTTGLNNGDLVYCVPAGVSYTGQQRGFIGTLSPAGAVPAGATNFYLTAAATTNLAAGSYIYPLSINWQTFVGSNSVSRIGDVLFETAGESPLRIIIDSTATNDLSVTVR